MQEILHTPLADLELSRFNDTGTTYRYVFNNPGELMTSAHKQIDQVDINPDILQEIGNQIAEKILFSDLDSSNSNLDLAKLGHRLYRLFLPSRLGPQQLIEAIFSLKNSLLITSDVPSIFWELLHDGEDFWCLKYNMGRRLLTRNVPVSIPKKEKQWRCLLISNPTGDLTNAEEESNILFESLSKKKVKCDLLIKENASIRAVSNALQDKEYDIIHFSGHITYDELGSQYAFLLHEEKKLWASNVREWIKGAPIVFLNGCGGAAGMKENTNNSPGLESLTEAFLEAGAQLIVGSQFVIPDQGASFFADQFFHAILKGNTAGEAMKKARIATRKQKAYGTTWARFVMYGDPRLKIEFRKDELGDLLNDFQFSRNDFSVTAVRVLDQALSEGQSYPGISSPQLFIALLSEKGSAFAAFLEAQDFPAESLKKAFQEVVGAIQDDTQEETQNEELTISPSVVNLLDYSKTIVEKEEREKITAKDLSHAFIKTGGGSTGEILNPLGIDFTENAWEIFNNKSSSSRPVKNIHISLPRSAPAKKVLQRAASSKIVYEIIRIAGEVARKNKSELISTLHLFMGFLASPSFSIHQLLKQQGIHPINFLQLLEDTLADNAKRQKPTERNGEPSYSRNVLTAIENAKQLAHKANVDKIREGDLLSTFIRLPDNSVKRLLNEMGLTLEIAFYHFFDSDGFLLKEKFDSISFEALQNAKELALKKGSNLISRSHLFYGFCKVKDSILYNYLLNEKIGFEQVQKKIDTLLKHQRAINVELALAFLSLGCTKVLMRAYDLGRKEAAEQITEHRILRVLLHSKRNSIPGLLKNLNLNPKEIIENNIPPETPDIK